MTTPATSRVRRSREQWQQLIDEHQASGLSQQDYCRDRGIAYGTFSRWRQRLLSAAPSPRSPAEPSFIELPSWVDGAGGRWQIELALGDGMVLRLSRG